MKTNKKEKKVLFFRNFKAFTGGHLKVWHYFNHLRESSQYKPYISFTNDTLWDKTNPWLPIKDELLSLKQGEKPDIAFIAGLDWLRWEEKQNIPIINLIQHVRHADPKQPLFSFLKNKAIRICVSEQVADALIQTKQVNGPIFTIPNGVDKSKLPDLLPLTEKRTAVLIAGIKNKALAKSLHEYLERSGIDSQLLVEHMHRDAYLTYVNQARITVFLPNKTEGFYLPALEGMALGTLVICPDCEGNRSFCLPDVNCIQPSYSFEALVDVINRVLCMDSHERGALLSNALLMVDQYTMERERHKFLNTIDQVSDIW